MMMWMLMMNGQIRVPGDDPSFCFYSALTICLAIWMRTKALASSLDKLGYRYILRMHPCAVT